jgi:hypothetical protein
MHPNNVNKEEEWLQSDPETEPQNFLLVKLSGRYGLRVVGQMFLACPVVPVQCLVPGYWL